MTTVNFNFLLLGNMLLGTMKLFVVILTFNGLFVSRVCANLSWKKLIVGLKDEIYLFVVRLAFNGSFVSVV